MYENDEMLVASWTCRCFGCTLWKRTWYL